jgi:ADP-ribose pyrophosphatase
MDYTEKTLRHVNAYHGIIVDVQTDMIQLPNGNITMREVVHHPGGVCVAAVDDLGLVTVVRQYRYPFGEHLLELPAGKLEKGEEPLPAAKRELSEETGLEADTWIDLGPIYTSPGFSTETLYIYLARDLHQGQAHPDPGEFLDVDKIPLTELVAMVEAGTVQDAKTVIGLLRTEQYFRNI